MNLPEKKKRTWIVDEQGGALQKVNSAGPLTLHQKHQRYRIAIQKAITVFQEMGFQLFGDPSGSQMSMSKGGLILDVHLKRRGGTPVAYVTSYEGYRYSDQKVGEDMTGAEIKKINAKVTFLDSAIKSKYYYQIGISAGSSSTPVFVELPDDCEDPEYFALKAIFATLADLGRQIPRLQKESNDLKRALGYDPDQIKIAFPSMIDSDDV